MSRQGQRIRIGRGVYRDATGIAAVVYVGTLRREQRFALDTDRETIKRWQDETRAALRALAPTPERRTFAADADHYLRLVSRMKGIVERTRHIREWVGIFGHRERYRITTPEIREQLETWRTEHRWSASSLNHRRTALGHLWSTLDGKGAPNPVRSVPRYREPDALPRGLPWATVRRILRAMPPSVTRIRLALIATTGLPHSTLGRLKAADVDIENRVYLRPPRQKGYGTRTTLVPLGRRAVWYFKVLNRAGGWGPFSRTSMWKSFIRGCRAAEREAEDDGELLDLSGVRPYDLRHSYGTAVYAATRDLEATRQLLGHARLSTTQRYTLAAVPAVLTDAVAKVEKFMAPDHGTKTAAPVTH